jgi:hypothetical protein
MSKEVFMQGDGDGPQKAGVFMPTSLITGNKSAVPGGTEQLCVAVPPPNVPANNHIGTTFSYDGKFPSRISLGVYGGRKRQLPIATTPRLILRTVRSFLGQTACLLAFS